MIDVSVRLRRGIHADNLLIVKRILKNNPKSVFNPDLAGNTSLHLAAQFGHLSIVRYFVEVADHECDGVSKNNVGDTPLMVAAAEGHEEVILLDMGADPEVADNLGNTALHYSAAYGHLKVIRTLVERGADVETQNRPGWTPINYSCTFEAEKYFQQLVQDREIRWLQAQTSGVEKLTPGFARSERMITLPAGG
ncbi:ankyrin repeat-containing domain protein [Trichophaea hybrida]|nr:ankyrin repeat-containing domain protein [Trichophaea hybrida]